MFVWKVTPGCEQLLAEAGLDSPEQLLTATGESLDKPGLESWRQRLRLRLSEQRQPTVLFLKRFDHPPAAARREVRRSGSGSRSVAGVEWAWLHHFREHGINCPSPVALAEEWDGRRERRSAVLIRQVPGRSLEAWARQWMAEGVEADVLASVLRASADLVRRLHHVGLAHRDLYLSHLFFDDAAPPAAKLHLIDLQRVFRFRWRKERWIVKDLAALHFSTPQELVCDRDRIRWLKRYRGALKLGPGDRRLLRQVAAKARGIARRDRRRTDRLRSAR